MGHPVLVSRYMYYSILPADHGRHVGSFLFSKSVTALHLGVQNLDRVTACKKIDKCQ